MKKDRDYSLYFAIMAMWIMVCALAQCESARNLDDIRRELSSIRYELNMMRYK